MSPQTLDRSATTETNNKTPRNEGLEPYDISTYTGLKNKNFFQVNTLLQRILKNVIPAQDHKAVFEHLEKFGDLQGSRVNDLLFEAYRDEKLGRFERFDESGNRVERIVYSEEMLEVKRLIYRSGITNLNTNPAWNRPFHIHHRYAGLFLSAMQGEAGLNCGLGMTEGLINLLKNVGTPQQRERWLPRLTDPDSDWHFTVGQFMSERVGGSNIGANRTVAYPRPDGTYKLVGEKWFCSNPGELWVSTARIADTNTIGVFLVSRIKTNGEINGHHILRKKNKLGARANLTLEMEYQDVEAEALGQPRHGLANLMRYLVNNTRVQMAFLSAGCSRRAFLEAREYTRTREAYGQKVIDFPSVGRTLLTLQTLSCAMELAVHRNLELYEAKNPASRFLTQWLKSKCSSTNSYIIREASMLHGANGTFQDFTVLPRLYVDGFMQEFWEGTHNIIAGHSIKAFFAPRVRRAFEAEIENNLAIARDAISPERYSIIRELFEEIKNIRKPPEEINRIALLDKVYNLFILSLFAREVAGDTDREIFQDFLDAFADISDRGVQGYLPPESVFMDPVKSRALIEY